MITSLILFGAGTAIGLMVVSYFPGLADHFEDAIAAFVKTFAGMPRLKLAAAIFVNNTLKTLLAILLGVLFGIIPAFFLLANGIGLGVAWSLSVSARGPWLSLLSLLPHGVLELPAVLLGTSIGLAIGIQALKRLTGKTDRKIGAELASGLRYFCSVILPLLFVAALVEAFVTAALVAPR
jgi:stage II sporulation protein M